VNELVLYIPAVIAMLVLLAFSAFFSCSEAAFFSLSQNDRLALAEKGNLGKLLLKLAKHPEQLLNSVLLGNLLVNLLFFTISSIMTFQIGKTSNWAWLIAVCSLFGLILFGEVLPKNIGVAIPQFFSILTALPLSLLVRLLKPVLPILAKLNILSKRVLCPYLEPEPYLLVSDLERAVAMSGNDAALLKREQRSLQNIVSLSDMRAEELMRPRLLLKTFKPPILFNDIAAELQSHSMCGDYCFLTEPNSDEITAVIHYARLAPTELEGNWEKLAEPVIYVPWSTSVAEVFERLQKKNRQNAVVVNELGETIGVITFDDIIETIFTREQGRSRRLLNRSELQRLEQNRWQLTGLTSLRLLRRKFRASFDGYSSLTVGGLLREKLKRLPRVGDVCKVESLQFKVVAVENDLELVVHLSVQDKQG
jgi:CBS domain containing-hemolysin-like protein